MKQIFAGLLVLTLAIPALADFKEGFAAYTRGDYELAIRELKPLAKKGHATAQFLLVQIYPNGQGAQQDYTEAAEGYRRAAEQGVTRA